MTITYKDETFADARHLCETVAERWLLTTSGHDWICIRDLYYSHPVHKLAHDVEQDCFTPEFMDEYHLETGDIASALVHLARCYDAGDLV